MNSPWYLLIIGVISLSIFYFFPDLITEQRLKAMVSLPRLMNVVSSSLPKPDELISNNRREELYLKAPITFTLPEIKIQNYDQEITVQLDPYEIRDTRRKGKDWQLVIGAQDLVSAKGKITKSNIAFRLDKNDIQPTSGSVEELTVTEGPEIRIAPKAGLGKGTFVFSPRLIIKIPQGSYSGEYRSQIDSTLD